MSVSEIVLFESSDGVVTLPVEIDAKAGEIWLTRKQTAVLFDRDIKTIGKHDNYVVREFDDEESAKLFVSLLRESEQRDFIRYRITKVINY